MITVNSTFEGGEKGILSSQNDIKANSLTITSALRIDTNH